MQSTGVGQLEQGPDMPKLCRQAARIAGLWLAFQTAAWAQVPTPLTRPGLVAQDSLSAADTAWMMTSTALVLHWIGAAMETPSNIHWRFVPAANRWIDRWTRSWQRCPRGLSCSI